MEDEGNLFIGLALGFFLGCIGLIIAFVALPQPKTKQGAIYGLVAQIVISVCLGGTIGVLGAVLGG
ncbi:MAG: hypothetical protein ACJAZO_004591 [Myxococcota bacterium]|jgi:hypothetical protein